jgi:hypothetical protein
MIGKDNQQGEGQPPNRGRAGEQVQVQEQQVQ